MSFDPSVRWDELYRLDKLGPDLVQTAARGALDFAFERPELLARLSVTLLTRNVLLVGPDGVGKRSLVNALAHRIADAITSGSERPAFFHQIFATDPNALDLGTHWAGELGEKLERLTAQAVRDRSILFIRDTHLAAGAGASSNQPQGDVANILNGALDRHPCRVIGETTPEGAHLLARHAPALHARFTILEVPPMDERTTRLLLEHARVTWSSDRGVRLHYTPDFVDEVMHACRTFFAGAAFPGKALDLARSAVDGASRGATEPVFRADAGLVHAHMAKLSGVSIDLLSRRPMPPGLLERSVRAVVESRVVGQPEAVDAAVHLVARFRARLNDAARPVGVLWLAGPSGVGKTEFAKALAQVFFGSEDRLLRYDMSEFREYTSTDRLVGSPTKRDAAHHAVPPLVDRVRRQPFSVVLFDEIEKAHPLVLDLMLQLLDEGRLTGIDGHVSHFNNAVILFTSNLGASPRSAAPGFERTAHVPGAEDIRQSIATSFRPELANRLETIVRFRSLDRATVERLLDREIVSLLRRPGLATVSRLVLTPGTREAILAAGYDVSYGARPLKRAVEMHVVAPVARLLACGTRSSGAIAVSPDGVARWIARRATRRRRASDRTVVSTGDGGQRW